MPLKIILDSNFLLIPAQFHVDILKELERTTNSNIEAILLSPVYEELTRLAKKGEIQRKQVAVALEYAKNLKVIHVETELHEKVDDVILRFATIWKCLVATNDRALRRKLRKVNIPVIYLRKKSYLEVDGNIINVPR